MEKKGYMKVLGGRNPRPYWGGFRRLQQRMQLLFGAPISPKGVFRFHDHDEFDAWRMKHHLKVCRVHRSKTI